MFTVIDVSNNNGGAIDWKRVKESGVAGVLLKASEGTGFTDMTFTERRANAEAVGLRVGYYHFAHPENNEAVAEAKLFCKIVGTAHRRDFKPVLDFEVGSPSPSYFQWIKDFDAVVKAKLGNFPIFYSYGPYITGLQLPRTVGNGLWLAAYGRNDGKDYGAEVPAPWKKWNLHQYSSAGRIGGVEGPCDVSHATTLRGLLAHPYLGIV